MDSTKIRQRFLDFFEKRGHTIVPSSSLVPQGDTSVLFTTAGMQQFKPYYTKPELAPANNAVSIQKCVRTSDIDEVGDERHLTFFEMLGNFSFGGYWKREAIQYAHEFITKEMGLTIDYVSVFGGEPSTGLGPEGIPADEESEKIWKSVDPSIVVKNCGRADNFWGPTGDEGPCGPTTEIYVDGIEIWNLVFNEFYQEKDKSLKSLPTKGVDTGMGLERLALVSQFPGQVGEKTIFDTDLFEPIMDALPAGDQRTRRIVADHVRSAVFIIVDDIVPSNTEHGYVLRRLIRRAVRYANTLGLKSPLASFIPLIAGQYTGSYSYILENVKIIENVVMEEEARFQKTLDRGLHAFEKGERDPFILFSTYGFPLELTIELAKERHEAIDSVQFEKQMHAHQEISRAGAEQKFKGGLAGHSDREVRLHTATHLLNAALREALGAHVKQRGSNITPERLRFDFSHPAKLTDEEKKKIEECVNEWIAADLPVVRREMPKTEAEQLGAQMEFGAKYPDIVSVYFIEDGKGGAISREFCGGPHVEHTGVLGHFKIIKEEAVAAGVRRIKAVLE